MNSVSRILKSLFVWSEIEQEVLAESPDSSLIQKHSKYFDYELTSYPSTPVTLRTVVIPHYKQNKFSPNDLPCVVFIHGLGGQISQFENLLDYFAYFAHVIAIDLPGCGQSPYVGDWNLYKPENLMEMAMAVLQHELKADPKTTADNSSINIENNPSDTNNSSNGSNDNSPSHSETKVPNNSSARIRPGAKLILVGHSMGTVLAGHLAEALESYPELPNCSGLIAITPPPPCIEARLAQTKKYLPYIPQWVFSILRAFDREGGPNSLSVSRMLSPSTEPSSEVRIKQLRWNLHVDMRAWTRYAYNFVPFGLQDWAKLTCPVLLIGAEHDKVTPPKHLEEISQVLRVESTPVIVNNSGHAVMAEQPHVVCGVIADFLIKKVDAKLSLGWQLSILAKESDKWSLKNENKWRNTISVGARVAADIPFRGMKTLRQDDPQHSPSLLEQNYPSIGAIIDISREPPPYDPKTFNMIKYHKFPTVSKLPPSKSEVRGFIDVAMTCISEFAASGYEENEKEIGVHCHYGFNRTGFFICCFMIEKRGYSVKEAIELYANSRGGGGIRHPHFIDELYVRYQLKG